jgi:hypothetical protein
MKDYNGVPRDSTINQIPAAAVNIVQLVDNLLNPQSKN